MEYLAAAGVEVHVLTSGNGLAYLGNKPGITSVNPMESFFYSGKDGGVSGWSTLKSLRRLAAMADRKGRNSMPCWSESNRRLRWWIPNTPFLRFAVAAFRSLV
jgi:hypothetical protein